MLLRKTLLAASAVALISTPTWALADQNPSDNGANHAPSTTPAGPPSTTPAGPPSTTPAGPPSTTPNNTDNPSASDHSQNSNHGGDKSAGDQDGHGASQGAQGQGNDPGKSEHPSHPQHPKHPGHPEHPSHPNNPNRPGKSHMCMPRSVAYIVSGTLVSQTLSKNANGTYSGDVTVDVTRTNRHAAGDQGMTKTYTLTDARVKLRVADIDHDGSVGLDDLVAGDRVKVIASITTLSKKCDQSNFTAQTTIHKVTFHAPVTPGT
jgi:hypothetical protein